MRRHLEFMRNMISFECANPPHFSCRFGDYWTRTLSLRTAEVSCSKLRVEVASDYYTAAILDSEIARNLIFVEVTSKHMKQVLYIVYEVLSSTLLLMYATFEASLYQAIQSTGTRHCIPVLSEPSRGTGSVT